MQAANESIEGNFEGIGVSFNMPSDTVVVMGVIPGGPSERAGIQLGDRIVAVNNHTIAGIKMAQDSVMRLLRGRRGTRVNVEVKRTGEPKPVSIEIVRDRIPVKSVDVAYMIDSKTGYIKLSKFSNPTKTSKTPRPSTPETAVLPMCSISTFFPSVARIFCARIAKSLLKPRLCL